MTYGTDIHHIALSSDDTYLVLVSQRGYQLGSLQEITVELWNLKTRFCISTCIPGCFLAFSANATYVALQLTPMAHRIRVYDVHSIDDGCAIALPTGEEFTGTTPKAVALSVDGAYLVFCDGHGGIRVYAVRTGHEIVYMEGHRTGVSILISKIDRFVMNVPVRGHGFRLLPMEITPFWSLSFDYRSGWIMVHVMAPDQEHRTIQLCWLPAELRSYQYATSASKIVISRTTGSNSKLTIIDLGPMLRMLEALGRIPAM